MDFFPAIPGDVEAAGIDSISDILVVLFVSEIFDGVAS